MIEIWWDLAEVEAMLTGVLRQAQHPQDIWDEIGQTLLDFVDQGFATESDPWGRKWEDLSEVTIERRSCSIGGILEDCGSLRNSFEAAVVKDEISVWSDLKKSGTMQWGARKGQYGTDSEGFPIPWGDIPPRPMLPIKGHGVLDLPQSWVEAVENVLEAHLEEAVAATPSSTFISKVVGSISNFFKGWF